MFINAECLSGAIRKLKPAYVSTTNTTSTGSSTRNITDRLVHSINKVIDTKEKLLNKSNDKQDNDEQYDKQDNSWNDENQSYIR